MKVVTFLAILFLSISLQAQNDSQIEYQKFIEKLDRTKEIKIISKFDSNPDKIDLTERIFNVEKLVFNSNTNSNDFYFENCNHCFIAISFPIEIIYTYLDGYISKLNINNSELFYTLVYSNYDNPDVKFFYFNEEFYLGGKKLNVYLFNTKTSKILLPEGELTIEDFFKIKNTDLSNVYNKQRLDILRSQLSFDDVLKVFKYDIIFNSRPKVSEEKKMSSINFFFKDFLKCNNKQLTDIEIILKNKSNLRIYNKGELNHSIKEILTKNQIEIFENWLDIWYPKVLSNYRTTNRFTFYEYIFKKENINRASFIENYNNSFFTE